MKEKDAKGTYLCENHIRLKSNIGYGPIFIPIGYDLHRDRSLFKRFLFIYPSSVRKNNSYTQTTSKLGILPLRKLYR